MSCRRTRHVSGNLMSYLCWRCVVVVHWRSNRDGRSAGPWSSNSSSLEDHQCHFISSRHHPDFPDPRLHTSPFLHLLSRHQTSRQNVNDISPRSILALCTQELTFVELVTSCESTSRTPHRISLLEAVFELHDSSFFIHRQSLHGEGWPRGGGKVTACGYGRGVDLPFGESFQGCGGG